mmetsp:Transcript_62241/g.180505  ORF Transcript_62241/g.180505 Transcript_62241/m.180505 type:complete len:213 (-) Transcript_62241:317-955(-)
MEACHRTRRRRRPASPAQMEQRRQPMAVAAPASAWQRCCERSSCRHTPTEACRRHRPRRPEGQPEKLALRCQSLPTAAWHPRRPPAEERRHYPNDSLRRRRGLKSSLRQCFCPPCSKSRWGHWNRRNPTGASRRPRRPPTAARRHFPKDPHLRRHLRPPRPRSRGPRKSQHIPKAACRRPRRHKHRCRRRREGPPARDSVASQQPAYRTLPA